MNKNFFVSFSYTILTVLSSLVIFVLFLTQINAQRRKNRKNRRGNASFARCHHRELESCANKMINIVKGENPGSVITTSSGIDLICKTIKEETLTCFTNYFQKCGTPLHKEMSNLVIEFIELRVDKFCNDEMQRSTLLSETPCYHKNVFSTDEYKTSCNNKFLSAGDSIDTNHTNVDTVLETVCCGYNTWHICTLNLMGEKCGENGRQVFKEFSANTIDRITDMVCPLSIFGVQSDTCSKIQTNLVGTNDERKSGANPITKYILNLFSFLFITEQ